MNIKPALAAIFAWAMIGLLADSAPGAPIQSKTKVEGKCNADGGTWFPPNNQGVYGCINDDGSGIVCGGKGANKNTCDTFKRQPGRNELPTRSGVQAEKTKKVEMK